VISDRLPFNSFYEMYIIFQLSTKKSTVFLIVALSAESVSLNINARINSYELKNCCCVYVSILDC